MLSIHTIEYYSAIKRQKLLRYMIWHDWSLETLYYGKEARHKRPNILWFQFYETFQIGKLIETESRLVVARV